MADSAIDDSSSATTFAGATRTAWLVVALLFPVALLNYLDRQMMASMKTSVMNDIPTIVSEGNWGFMLAQFKWIYAIFSLAGGYIADRFSRRWAICISLFVWSTITWLTAHTTTYTELLWVRTFMGISEAFYYPAALALIADYHVGATRSRAVGLHQVAIYIGVIVGGLSGFVADNPNFGWRFAFTACGLIGILYSIPLVTFLRDAPRTSQSDASDPPPYHGGSFWELLSNRNFLLLVAYFTLPALAGWVVKDWMPAILKDRFEIGQGHAGFTATFYLQIASIFGAFLGGWFADSWVKRNIRGRIYVSALGMAMIVPAIFGIGIAPTLLVAIAFLSLFGLGWAFFDCNNMPILAQIARPHLRATGYGIMNFVSISVGGLADWGFGHMRDKNVPLGIVFGSFAAVGVISIVFVLLIQPRRE